MELYWKAAAAALIALVLGQAVQHKEIALMLSMTVCVMVTLVLMRFIEPIFSFLQELQKLGDVQWNMLEILLKALGIGIVTQITETVCKDSGNSSLAHAMTLLGTAAVLWLSLPVFTGLLGLIRSILGGI